MSECANGPSIDAVTDLHLHRFGPAGPTQVLAIHGLTGHGKRWQTLATRHLTEFAVTAPDLLGHGRSTWAAPWTIDANAAALAELLDGADGGRRPFFRRRNRFGARRGPS